MQITITRRDFIKTISVAAASLGLGLTAFPAAGFNPSSGSVQVLDRANQEATSTPSSLLQKPDLSGEEVTFLANHELITGDTHRKVVMMTYDDVLDNQRLSHLLDVYLEQGIKCSFFIIGIDLENCRATIPRLIHEGHDLGCHGWVHDSPLTSLSDENINDQFAKFFTKVNEIVPGYRVRYIRAPFGARNQRVRDLAASWGMQHVLWSLESGGQDRETIHYVVDRVQNGSIVLSHAHRYYDVTEADVIVRELIRKGFSLENLSSGMDPKDKWVGV
jgi:peptidoglycan/xylan/chitin deacetylase (PgdA/CDA1 family)